jgi:hypothetical protein
VVVIEGKEGRKKFYSGFISQSRTDGPRGLGPRRGILS